MKFHGLEYRDFLKQFKDPFLMFPSIADDGEKPGRLIYLRHDIDDNIENSVAMAKIEAGMGIKSTYFVLDTADYFKRNISKELNFIRDCGHEIGWHNNALYSWYADHMQKSLKFYIIGPLYVLRTMYGITVRGSASHFVPNHSEHLFHNYNIWTLPYKFQSTIANDQFTLEEFGLEYETYFLQRDIYLCDSANRWNRDMELTVEDFNGRENCKMQILIHPQWWL